MGNRKEILPFPAALHLSTSDDSQTPWQGKILSSWDVLLAGVAIHSSHPCAWRPQLLLGMQYALGVVTEPGCP